MRNASNLSGHSRSTSHHWQVFLFYVLLSTTINYRFLASPSCFCSFGPCKHWSNKPPYIAKALGETLHSVRREETQSSWCSRTGIPPNGTKQNHFLTRHAVENLHVLKSGWHHNIYTTIWSSPNKQKCSKSNVGYSETHDPSLPKGYLNNSVFTTPGWRALATTLRPFARHRRSNS